MGRLGRQTNEGDDPTTSLGTATEDLKTSVEHKIREIVEAAEARAVEIEEEAARRARLTEQEADRKAREILEKAFTRASRVLGRIDSLKNELSALRVDVESLSADLESTGPAAQARESQEEMTAVVTEEEPGEREEYAAVSEEDEVLAATEEQPGESQHSEPSEQATETAGSLEETPDLSELFREKIVRMHDEGKPRAEAEDFLTRFKVGASYLDMLDEVYSEAEKEATGPRQQRKRFGRRSRRADQTKQAAERVDSGSASSEG